MGCVQGKTSAPKQVQNTVPASTLGEPQSEPRLLGTEATPHEQHESQSGKAEFSAENTVIAKSSGGSAELTFTSHKGCIPAGDDLGKEVITVAEAKCKALELAGCKGFCFPGVDDGRPVEVFFKSTWKLVQVDTPWTAIKLEASDTELVSKSPEAVAQHTCAENSTEAAVAELQAEVHSSSLQAASQPEEASQQTAAAVALTTADEEAASLAKPGQSTLDEQEEVKTSVEQSAEKPAEKP